jgi:DNA-binding MarR family transcriptional regulator
MPVAASSRIDVAPLASRLRFSVTRLARKLRVESRAGVSPTLMAALATVETHGPMTPGDLARHEQVQRPTVTRILRELIAQGLVSRSPDPVDGRVAWIRITPEGRRLLQRVRRRHDEYVARRLASLDQHYLETLERAAAILDRIAERPEEAHPDGEP